MRRTPGPTGDFPRGKLNERDMGGLMLAIGEESGCVRIDFGEKIAWLAMPPKEALAFAAAIAARAASIAEL